MKIILLKDIPKLGKKGDVKEVSDGYARNYLLKNNMVAHAEQGLVNAVARHKEAERQQEEREQKAQEELARRLKSLVVTGTLKLGKDGSIFGSIGVSAILAILAKQGIALDKSQILLEHPIKTLGKHAVKIKLPHGIGAEVNLNVEKE